jgi:hypothetical protein
VQIVVDYILVNSERCDTFLPSDCATFPCRVIARQFFWSELSCGVKYFLVSTFYICPFQQPYSSFICRRHFTSLFLPFICRAPHIVGFFLPRDRDSASFSCCALRVRHFLAALCFIPQQPILNHLILIGVVHAERYKISSRRIRLFRKISEM